MKFNKNMLVIDHEVSLLIWTSKMTLAKSEKVSVHLIDIN